MEKLPDIKPESQNVQPVNQSVQPETSVHSGILGIAAVFATLSIILTIYGLYKLYDNSYQSQIVGGDAYNYIIYATRGTAWICAGIVSALMTIATLLIGILKNQK